MEENTYLRKIDCLNSCLTGENAKEILKEVDALEKWKPVRVPLYALKARALYYSGMEWDRITTILSEKCNASYDYPGVQEIIKVYKELAMCCKDQLDIRRNDRISNNSMQKEADINTESIELLYKNIVNGNFSENSLIKLRDENYVCQEWVMYHTLSLVLNQMYQIKDITREWTNQIYNIGYLKEYLLNKKQKKVCFIGMVGQNNIKFNALKKCLQMLGKDVIEVDTVDEAIEEITGFALVFSTVKKFKDLEFHKQMGYLYIGYEKYDDEIGFGWIGNYLDYLSDLYGEDCNALVNEEPVKKFSIIIPARNSADTLRYTLRTCIEQWDESDYEIIISDNSTGHNVDVYELCKEWNDSKIRYMKTPRDLPLSKSFEYAYIHAKGEYIFALGSDDGLLPWGLSALEEVIEAFPNEEIIQWERGFYAWPGFNGGQQNQFMIPRKYEKDILEVEYRDNIDYLAMILNNSREMYSLPMLYINSCFKHSYMETLMAKTGRLWDGICQDIYMGVLTACIHDKILNLKYPLTIAGMSSGSVGAKSNIGEQTNKEFETMMKERKHDNNAGCYCQTEYEKLIAFTGTDTSSLYTTLLRMVSMNIIPKSYLTEVFDWKKMFQNLSSELDIRDVTFDRKIHEMYYAASLHGKEFLDWFEKNDFKPMLKPVLVDEERLKKIEEKKIYTNSRNAEGGVVLDAAEYGVKNVYDAIKLFEKLTGL